ncbi:MAG TPA: metallophosphoesterase family protein [Vicinamibacterales bacterium]|nr:metallophosphoesterase family protein [Vicinamibacterales bacterium]
MPNRVAALYDIHGNLPALEAVLGEVAALGVGRVVVGGDVMPGPMPVECLDALAAVGVPVDYIAGNGESAVLAAIEGRELPRMPESAAEGVRWVGRALRPDQSNRIRTWPLTHALDVVGVGRVLFCHATPRNNTEIFTRQTPDAAVAGALAGVAADVVVCGHTHMQHDRRVGTIRVVNAGSIGMPFGRTGADWLLLGPGVELRHTTYDLTAAAGQLRATSFPAVDEFTSKYVLDSPAEEAMLAMFKTAEIS